MAIVTFTIPASLVTELNAIAVAAGFPGARAMVLAYLKAEVRAWRGNNAQKGIREAAEAKADEETEGIA